MEPSLVQAVSRFSIITGVKSQFINCLSKGKLLLLKSLN